MMINSKQFCDWNNFIRGHGVRHRSLCCYIMMFSSFSRDPIGVDVIIIQIKLFQTGLLRKTMEEILTKVDFLQKHSLVNKPALASLSRENGRMRQYSCNDLVVHFLVLEMQLQDYLM